MADTKTVGDGIEELREACERFGRFAGDEKGRGMATWFQGCADLIREIIEKALAVHPDGPFGPHCQLVVGPDGFARMLVVIRDRTQDTEAMSQPDEVYEETLRLALAVADVKVAKFMFKVKHDDHLVADSPNHDVDGGLLHIEAGDTVAVIEKEGQSG